MLCSVGWWFLQGTKQQVYWKIYFQDVHAWLLFLQWAEKGLNLNFYVPCVAGQQITSAPIPFPELGSLKLLSRCLTVWGRAYSQWANSLFFSKFDQSTPNICLTNPLSLLLKEEHLKLLCLPANSLSFHLGKDNLNCSYRMLT